MISVLSAVAEIERENIRVQTMEGRMQKAREGKWNGGFAAYGYSLIDGKLEVNEEEAVAIRMIFDQYVNTDLGANGIAKYLENHGIHKIARQNGKNPLFDAAYLLVDGLHEALVSEEVWEQVQVKVAAQAKKYEKVNRDKREKIHLLSGILKCPVCGAGMYGNKSIKKRKDGSNYKDFYYYGCKHRNMTRGHKCDYKKQVHEEMLDASVAEELLVSAKAKKRSLLADKITGDNIYKALVFFDKLYAQMNEAEKREFLSQLVDNVQIYEERKENGQWLKSIEFKLPVIEKEFTLSLDNDTQNETVCLLSRKG